MHVTTRCYFLNSCVICRKSSQKTVHVASVHSLRRKMHDVTYGIIDDVSFFSYALLHSKSALSSSRLTAHSIAKTDTCSVLSAQKTAKFSQQNLCFTLSIKLSVPIISIFVCASFSSAQSTSFSCNQAVTFYPM